MLYIRGVGAAICLLSLAYLHAQTAGAIADPPKVLQRDALPSAELVFSRTKTDSPLQLPIPTVMSGGPRCGPDGRAFLQIMTQPPMYNHRVIYSVIPDGTVTRYPVEQIVGLTNAAVVSFDPGTSKVVMILKSSVAGQSRASSSGYYLALFTYDGEFRKYSKLDIGIQPANVAQLDDDSFLSSERTPRPVNPKCLSLTTAGAFSLISLRMKLCRLKNSLMPRFNL